MYTWGIKDFHKCWSGSLARGRLCLQPAGVINCSPLSALSFWVSLFPRMRVYNKSCLTLCNPMECSMPRLPVHHQLPELTQTHIHWVSDAIQPSHPVIPFSSHLQSFPGSGSFPMSQLFASGGQKCWSFSLNSLSNEYWGLISFRMDWLDLLVVQGTLKSLLWHHSWKDSILQSSALFIVQLSDRCMTTGKSIALTRQNFVGKVMSLILISCLGCS